MEGWTGGLDLNLIVGLDSHHRGLHGEAAPVLERGPAFGEAPVYPWVYIYAFFEKQFLLQPLRPSLHAGCIMLHRRRGASRFSNVA